MEKIEIVKAAYGGYGLGFIQGKAIFVPQAFPGDRLNVRITRDHPGHSFAEIESFIAPSSLRREARCPLSGECGGCGYLSIDYKDELNIKKEILVESLNRIGKLAHGSFPSPEMIAGPRYGYRSHATVKHETGTGNGFFRKRSNTLVPFPDQGCLLLDHRLAAALKDHNPGEYPEFRAALAHDGACRISTGSKERLIEKEGDFTFTRDIWNFYQGNRYIRGSMLALASRWAEVYGTGDLLDIGCGVGFFTIPCGRYFRECTGMDIDGSSVSHAVENAKLNGITNCRFIEGNIDTIKPGRYAGGTVIIDPPRTGLSKRGLKNIIAMAPKTIIAFSCDPASFARDCSRFIKEGYVMKELVFIDMFPGTHHIESAALLTGGGAEVS